jgi:hypothetical protein
MTLEQYVLITKFDESAFISFPNFHVVGPAPFNASIFGTVFFADHRHNWFFYGKGSLRKGYVDNFDKKWDRFTMGYFENFVNEFLNKYKFF